MKARTTRTYTSGRNREQHWYVEVYTQPWKDYWTYKLYHFYDMKIPVKIPGWRLFERILEKFFEAEVRIEGNWIHPVTKEPLYSKAPRWCDRLVSWSVNQDLRCYELSVRNRTSVGRVEVDALTYRKLGEKWL